MLIIEFSRSNRRRVNVHRLGALHGRGDGVERRADLRTKPAGRGDDANGNQRSDEAVFDSGRTRLVLRKTPNTATSTNASSTAQ
jgi:hypothetical protein